MTDRTPAELRRLAKHFRDMCDSGSDECLKAALLELATEFEQEAEKLEASAPKANPQSR
jgi:hypothetical protein